MIAEIAAGLRAILEPDESVARDETAAEPFDYQPGTLYVFPSGPIVDNPIETGPTVRADFAFTAAFLFEGHEEANRTRLADVTAAIDEKVTAYLDAVRNNQRVAGAWDYIRGASLARPPATLQGRAAAISITGYLIRS